MRVKYYLPAWKSARLCTDQSRDDSYHSFRAAEQVRYLLRGKGFKHLSINVTEAIRNACMWRDHNGQSVFLAHLQAKNLSYFPVIPWNARIPIITGSYYWND
jgi:hypothetical protein